MIEATIVTMPEIATKTAPPPPCGEFAKQPTKRTPFSDTVATRRWRPPPLFVARQFAMVRPDARKIADPVLTADQPPPLAAVAPSIVPPSMSITVLLPTVYSPPPSSVAAHSSTRGNSAPAPA
eukprot:scaffold36453_cov34-Phaeocystis_antarctica.AAC.3